MIREERVKREKRVQILGASACAEAYNTGVSGNCLVLSALMRFLFLVFIKSFSLFKRYCPLWVPCPLKCSSTPFGCHARVPSPPNWRLSPSSGQVEP